MISSSFREPAPPIFSFANPTQGCVIAQATVYSTLHAYVTCLYTNAEKDPSLPKRESTHFSHNLHLTPDSYRSI